jgi:hypothetical protein
MRRAASITPDTLPSVMVTAVAIGSAGHDELATSALAQKWIPGEAKSILDMWAGSTSNRSDALIISVPPTTWRTAKPTRIVMMTTVF